MSARSIKLLAVAVLVLFVLSSAQSAFAAVAIAYDDGSAEGGISESASGGLFAVRFSLAPSWTSAKILTARFYMYGVAGVTTPFTVHIFGADKTTDLLTPSPSVAAGGAGWFDVDVSASNIVVTGDFYIAAEFTTANAPTFGVDFGGVGHVSYARSYSRVSSISPWVGPDTNHNYMFRAVVDPTTGPTLVLTPNPVTQGTSVVITGSGFPVSASGAFVVFADNTGKCSGSDYTDGGISSDASGNLGPVTIPTSGLLSVGTHCVETVDFVNNAVSSLTVNQASPIPEYPYGLPLLAIFMVIAYGLIRRKTQT